MATDELSAKSLQVSMEPVFRKSFCRTGQKINVQFNNMQRVVLGPKAFGPYSVLIKNKIKSLKSQRFFPSENQITKDDKCTRCLGLPEEMTKSLNFIQFFPKKNGSCQNCQIGQFFEKVLKMCFILQFKYLKAQRLNSVVCFLLPQSLGTHDYLNSIPKLID